MVIRLLLFLALALPCFGQVRAFTQADPAWSGVVATPAAPAGGETYWFRETFEGSTGFASGCDSNWPALSAGSGTIDPDVATTDLDMEGDDCCRLTFSTSAKYTTIQLPADVTELWGRLRIRITTDAGTDTVFLGFRNAANDTTITSLTVASNEQFRMSGGGSSANSAAMAVNTTYYAWFHFKTGTGDAVVECGRIDYADPVPDRPTGSPNWISFTTATFTTAMRYLRLGYSVNQTQDFYVDELILSNTEPTWW